MAETRSQSKESQLDKLKETIDDKNAQIGERIHALLLLLRSRKAEEENLHIHACPASSQVSDCDEDQFEHRTEKLVPEPQEQVVMNENLGQERVQKNFTKGFDVKGDVERGQKRLSMEKVCCAHKVFAKMSQHKETLGIKKKQKGLKSWRFKFKHRVAPRDSKSGFEVKMKQNPSKEYPYKMLLEGRFEVPTSTDLWLLKERGSPPEIAIGCELEAGEIDTTIDQNQLIQEEAKNHSTGLVHETSLLHHKSSLLKHQVSISHWEFSHRSPIESMDVYEELPTAIVRSLIGIVDDLHSDCGSDIWCVQYLVNSVVVGDLQETQWLFNDELEDIQKLQIVIKGGINSYACPEFNEICLRSHILHQQKKPKSFLEIEVRREDVQHVLWAFLHMKAIETRYATGECDEICEVRFQVKHKWRFKLLHLVSEMKFSLESVACFSLSDDQCNHCVVVRTRCVGTTQMQFGGESNNVWHRWKARYSQNFDSRVWDPGG